MCVLKYRGKDDRESSIEEINVFILFFVRGNIVGVVLCMSYKVHKLVYYHVYFIEVLVIKEWFDVCIMKLFKFRESNICGDLWGNV